MKTPEPGVSRKVGECLYRYSSNGVYYARFKSDGKEFRRSLETTDPAEARRKLAAEKQKERQTDRSQGKLTLRELWSDGLKQFKVPSRKRLSKRATSLPESKTSGRPVIWFKWGRSSQAIVICGWHAARTNHQRALVLHRAMRASRYSRRCSRWRCAIGLFPIRQPRI